MNNDIDIRRARLATKAKWAAGLAAAALIAPFIALAIGGLVGLAVAGVIGLAIINFAPVAAMKFANWKLKAIKAEARTNPIESRQNVALQRHERLKQVKSSIEAFGAEVRNVGDQVKDLRKNGQGADADELEVELVKLQQDFEDQMHDFDSAQEALAKYEDETLRLGRRWRASEALLKARKASGTEMDRELEKLVSQESTDAVNTQMNLAFAGLDVDRASRRRRLQNNPSPTIDVKSVEVRERMHS